ncbi:HAMP domain-containing protein [bacterium]|nr:HAMP domain-containing protein [bacterium]
MAAEKRKSKKKHNKQQYKNAGTQFQLRNTIMSTVLFGLLIFVSIFMLIMYSIVSNALKTAQIETRSKIFSQYSMVQEQVNNIEFAIEQDNNEQPEEEQNEQAKSYIVKNNKYNQQNNNMSEEVNSIKPENCIVKGILIYENTANKLVGASDEKLWTQYKDTPIALSQKKNKDKEKKTDIIKIDFPSGKYYMIYFVEWNNSISNSADIDKFINFLKLYFSIALAISFFIIYTLARSISKPLIDMEKTVSKIAQGDLSGRLEFTKYDEINQLVQSYNVMANALQRLYSTLEKQVQDRTQELKNAYAELQSTQAMMVHSEKMKSLGELVAGIMHEINNPINFIYGNMTHLSNYSNDLFQIIEEYTKFNGSLKDGERAEIENLKQEIDYEFLKSDLPDLIKSCKEGADRAKNIIQDLKSFSRMEEVAISDVDLGREIDTVLNILHNKIKNKAEIHKEYTDSSIPAVEAFGGQLNQVFMNILDNAVGAIEEHGDIWIRMNKDETGKKVIVEIEDNGKGMDSETMDKVFNPFFTTKPVGQGTGLGMSISYKIIKNHQGDIRVESTPGKGSKFIVTLPINLDRDALNAAVKNGEANG